MDTIEISGRTLEEAVQLAAKELGVSVDAVEYEIVEEGTKGFLGLGQSPTVIKAKAVEGAVPIAARKEPEAKPKEVEEVQAQPAAAAPSGESMKTFTDVVMKVVTDVLKAMDIAAKPVVVSNDNDEVTVNIEGKDVAILIGKHGQTLDALQYLISIAANRMANTRLRVILDAEGYRRRHQEMLEQKAHEYARAVKAEGQEAVLEPQSPRDRRIIHMTLADDPDVYTYSEGEGDDRHVVISPKK